MADDILRELGHLCLGSRLKRLGERLQADTQRVIDESGQAVQAAHCPLLAALDRRGPMTVGALVQALGVSQPSVTRAAARLDDLGLIEFRRVDGDQRKKTVALSSAGRRLVDRAKAGAWPRIEAAVEDLCAERTGTLLELVETLEDDLAAKPLGARPGRRRA